MITEFEDTPPMSSYLFALVVSDYSCRNGTARPSASREVDVRVCARSNVQDQLDLALETAVQVSEFFENYYGIQYPLSKIGKIIAFDQKFSNQTIKLIILLNNKEHAAIPQLPYGGKIKKITFQKLEYQFISL
jgi:aminopeptidase N